MADDFAPFDPPDWLDREDDLLAPYAMRARRSRGRRRPEADHAFRTPFSATAIASSTAPPSAA